MTCHDGGGKAVNVMRMFPRAYTSDRYRIVLKNISQSKLTSELTEREREQ